MSHLASSTTARLGVRGSSGSSILVPTSTDTRARPRSCGKAPRFGSADRCSALKSQTANRRRRGSRHSMSLLHSRAYSCRGADRVRVSFKILRALRRPLRLFWQCARSSSSDEGERSRGDGKQKEPSLPRWLFSLATKPR